MGKIQITKGPVHFFYTEEFIDIYKDQPAELLTEMGNAGRHFGYSAANVFYLFLIRAITERITNEEIRSYYKTNG